MGGKGDEVGHIPHHPVGEEGPLHLPAPAAGALAVQQIQQGQGAVVVAVEHRRLPVTVLGPLGQLGILLDPVSHPDGLDGRAGAPGGHHVLVPPVLVLADEPVRCGHDGGGGPVVLLQKEDPAPGVLLLKPQQGSGVRRPEAVDALVLVPH